MNENHFLKTKSEHDDDFKDFALPAPKAKQSANDFEGFELTPKEQVSPPEKKLSKYMTMAKVGDIIPDNPSSIILFRLLRDESVLDENNLPLPGFEHLFHIHEKQIDTNDYEYKKVQVPLVIRETGLPFIQDLWEKHKDKYVAKTSRKKQTK